MSNIGLKRAGFMLSFAVAVCISFQGCSFHDSTWKDLPSREDFRNKSVKFIRQLVDGATMAENVERPDEIVIDQPCTVVAIFFLDGVRKASGRSLGEEYSEVLEDAVRKLYKKGDLAELSREDLDRGRFYVAVMFDNGKRFSFVEYNGKGLELTGKVTAVRHLDKNLIMKNIDEGKKYLLRMIDPEMHGIFKRYDAILGDYDGRLRTIFTSSTLYTLMKMGDVKKDERIEVIIPEVAGFILSMQKQDEPYKGAFYYSYFQDTVEKENKVVVGTASKTIFTLLELYRRTGDDIYMSSAKNAGEWLLTMIGDDGEIINSMTLVGNEWAPEIKLSYLYSGQCLSAMARLYTATGDERYLKKADGLAGKFIGDSVKAKYFVNDEWRGDSDPIPTSWVVMSLLDYYKVTGDAKAKEVILFSADELIGRQNDNPRDIRDYGRYYPTATSGGGWIVEILSEVYDYGKKNGWVEVDKYKVSILKAIRWLIQDTYSPENTFLIRNAEKVYGGPIHQYDDDAVRTDAVCHGVNGYLGILPYLTEEDVINVPEKQM